METSKKKVAIVQSNYIPWKGYFDIINMVDEFVLYDDCQYTRRDWRNRNKIKTENGLQWLTIPVNVKGKFHQEIRDVKIADSDWARKHWGTLCQHYKNAEHFKEFKDIFECLYLSMDRIYLSEINYIFISEICKTLGIDTTIRWSYSITSFGSKTERLAEICRKTGATEYVSGPIAKKYIDEPQFEEIGCKITWMDYSNYPQYHQLYDGFTHEVSVLDLLFNEGKMATKYMKSFKG